MNSLIRHFCRGALPLLLSTSAFAQHFHIDAGAPHNGLSGSAQGDPLGVANGTQFLAPYVFQLTATNSPTLPGFNWQISGLTFTALHQGSGPGFSTQYEAQGATSGSFLELQIVSVSGPANGAFAIYDTNTASAPQGSTRPGQLIQLESGASGGTERFNLTDLAYYADGDTYGHVHGRIFAMNAPGVYDVTFQLQDTSASVNDFDGATHPASVLFTLRFSAIPEPGTGALLVCAGCALLTLHRPRSLRQSASAAQRFV